MEELILIKKLEESLRGRKVVAALFYTYNFDSRFFENYLLPIFFSGVPFNNNEIQNTILWRHYQKHLPPITVYCDFFAKDKTAPSLAYNVRPIVLKNNDVRRPAFHPKLSYLLLNDSGLIIISGSNNLSFPAWTTNLEVFTITEFKNGIYYPRTIKDDYKRFIEFVNDIYGKEYTDAETAVLSFFRKVLYTKKIGQYKGNYSSAQSSFFDKLEELKAENHAKKFKSVEIISPYFSSSVVVQNIRKYVDGDIKISIPYSANNVASVPKELFESYQKENVLWSDVNVLNKEKVFRFNHSKIFRFYGEDKVFTIIGSANLSAAALDGYRNKGNVEFATIFSDMKNGRETDLLKIRSSFEDIVFEEETGESEFDERRCPPELDFTLDWCKKELVVENPDKIQAAIYLSEDESFSLCEHRKKSKTTIDLSDSPDLITILADNPTIKVKYQNAFFEFYPKQIFIEQRPLPSKIKINDIELIKLWQLLENNVEADKTKITNYIEHFIEKKYDEFGNEFPIKENNESILNYMAAHLAAIIGLEKKLFKECPCSTQRGRRAFNKNQKSLIEYYLIADNIDTVTGYRRILAKKYEEKEMIGGFYWLLLKILWQKLYKNQRAKQISKDPDMKKSFNRASKELSDELQKIEKLIKVDPKILIWVGKNL